MKISTKTQYAIRALIIIAADVTTTSEKIATAEGISKKYLDSILHELFHAGILLTNRGAKGGYSLAKKADEITVFDVFCVFEKTDFNIKCAENPLKCSKIACCKGYSLWQKVSDAAKKVLTDTKISDLLL